MVDRFFVLSKILSASASEQREYEHFSSEFILFGVDFEDLPKK